MARSGSPWAVRLALLLLYTGCTAGSSAWSVHRYRNFASGWAWDLAHVNQSFWAIRHGVDRITVRPANHYAREGPEPWRSVHLAPLRFMLLLPPYWIWPRPETLLVGHCAIFWLSLFGVAALARSAGVSAPPESDRSFRPLVAATLWILTPAAFPMALNDCRPLQLGVPFLLWAVVGYVNRRPWQFASAALATLCARQEYGFAIAALAILPAESEEKPARAAAWRLAALLLGVSWFAGYLIYLRLLFGSEAVRHYFIVPPSFARKGPLDILRGFPETIVSLAVLSGGWWLLALRSPRYLLASLPILYMIVQRNLTRLIPADEEWHFLRYAAIPLAFWVAGGARALGRIRWPARWERWSSRRRWLVLFLGGTILWAVPASWIELRLASVPPALDPEDRQPLGDWIRQIPADASVWTEYSYAAMLSGRARLYALRESREWEAMGLAQDQWAVCNVSIRRQDVVASELLRMLDFEEVYHGKSVSVWHRSTR